MFLIKFLKYAIKESSILQFWKLKKFGKLKSIKR